MKVTLHEPTFGDEEIQAACEQMRTTHVTMGLKVREFEEQCAEYFGVKYCVMCNSGSSANLLAVAALANPAWKSNLKPGDEVIVPALSWATTVWPLIQHGLIPVFVDCDLDTYNFDMEKLEGAITEKTKAIMLVHVYGNPCDMGEIFRIAEANNLFIIGDCCEAMGAYVGGQSVAALGTVTTMSLYYSHHITTFEGGLCFTDNRELAELMRILRAHGWSREADDKQKYIDKYPDIDPRFIFVNIGYNLRPTEVQAVIGMKQLPKLQGFVDKRALASQEYSTRFIKYKDFFRFQEEAVGFVEGSYFGYGIVLREHTLFTVKEITAYLQSKGIETRPIIAGNMARHPALKMYEHRISGTLANCDIIMQRGFAIGCHQGVNKEQVHYVDKCIGDFIDQYNHERESE